MLKTVKTKKHLIIMFLEIEDVIQVNRKDKGRVDISPMLMNVQHQRRGAIFAKKFAIMQICVSKSEKM